MRRWRQHLNRAGAASAAGILTVTEDGSWKLEKGTLYDVTHLPCRAARYCGGSPANADLSDFPVTPGAEARIHSSLSAHLQLAISEFTARSHSSFTPHFTPP